MTNQEWAGKTALIMNGLTLDKALLNHTINQIALDPQIGYAIELIKEEQHNRKLAQLGRNILDKFDTTEIIHPLLIPISAPVNIVTSVCKLLSRKSLDDIIKTIPHEIPPEELQSLNNFSYWKIFLSNLSDAQGLISLGEFNNLNNKKYSKVKYVYCSRPYYENMYIDTIQIKMPKKMPVFDKNKEIGADLKSRWQIIDRIKKIRGDQKSRRQINDRLTKQYLKDLIDLHIISIVYAGHISKNARAKLSELNRIKDLDTDKMDYYLMDGSFSDRSLFGIFFLSGFLNYLFQKKDILVEFSNDFFRSTNPTDQEKWSLIFAKELLLLAGDPGKMEFFKEGSHEQKPRIIIQSLNTSRTLKGKTNFENVFNYSEDEDYINISIPIKRILSVPSYYLKKFDNTTMYDINQFIDLYPLPDVFKDDDLELFALGGAEHNLPLAHLINVLRYKQQISRHFGFVENAYDLEMKKESRGKKPQFLMSLEKRVSGMNAQWRERECFNSDPENFNLEYLTNQAEILKIVYPEKKISGFSFYGFSAPMTRVAFIVWLLNKNEGFTQNLEKKDIEKKSEQKDAFGEWARSKIAVYELGEKESNNPNDERLFKNIMEKLDQFDVMNNFNKLLDPNEDYVTKLLIEYGELIPK